MSSVFLNITTNEEQYERALDLLGGYWRVEEASRRASNRAALAARTLATKEIRKKFTISARHYKERLVIKKAKGDNPAFLTITGHRFPLTYFKYRAQRGQEAQVSVVKGRYHPVKGAFE